MNSQSESSWFWGDKRVGQGKSSNQVFWLMIQLAAGTGRRILSSKERFSQVREGERELEGEKRRMDKMVTGRTRQSKDMIRKMWVFSILPTSNLFSLSPLSLSLSVSVWFLPQFLPDSIIHPTFGYSRSLGPEFDLFPTILSPSQNDCQIPLHAFH